MTQVETQYLQIDPNTLPGREGYHLLTGVVVPRPIAWLSTVGENGVFNVAPHSFFNCFASNPLMVAFSSTGVKDTLRNIRYTWDFVVNVVSEDLVDAMNLTATDFPPEESEFEWARLTPAPSVHVKAPRVAEAKAAMECRVVHMLELGRAPSYMVIGEVLMLHVDPSVMKDGRVDPELLRPVGRLAGSGYSHTAASLFKLPRLTWAELHDRKPPIR